MQPACQTLTACAGCTLLDACDSIMISRRIREAELAGIMYLDGDVKSAAGMLRKALLSQYL